MQNTRDMVIHLWTDGGCHNNGKPNSKGSWAFIIERQGKIVFKKSGNKVGTTNNEMELTAILNGLNNIQKNKFDGYVVVYSDSQYAVKGLQSWIFKWAENGWKTANGTTIKNKDIWIKLYHIFYTNKFRDLTFQWVSAHKGNQFNELVDTMCKDEMFSNAEKQTEYKPKTTKPKKKKKIPKWKYSRKNWSACKGKIMKRKKGSMK